ncbi:MAG: hypothetical protein ABT10_02660 [Novosphingobium sp. SCN 63-17]|nr:MAG: hypothetical protein ABT10_02660 [Novosphingobium sp. SCN 63-17]OJX92846.1 MAG: hypothetical protein BGP00_23265 [Novosphingobium sp. 63-713]
MPSAVVQEIDHRQVFAIGKIFVGHIGKNFGRFKKGILLWRRDSRSLRRHLRRDNLGQWKKFGLSCHDSFSGNLA